MHIDQVFHLTPLVDDIDAAAARFEAIFAPHIWYRGYESQVNNRDAALMAIADFVIEPMAPRVPFDDRPATSHRRYIERFGEGIHSLAVYATGLDEIGRRCEDRGIRTTDGGMPACIFPHPKDFPGLIEFFDPTLDPRGRFDLNPRRHPTYSSVYWRDVHPLGIEFASHVTLAVDDHQGAAKAYADLLAVDVLPDQAGRSTGCDSSYVTFGPDMMIELAQPRDDSPLAVALAEIGTSWWGVTFKVRDLDSVEEYLSFEHIAAPIERSGNTLRIDRDFMFGAEYAFTDEALAGDPRVS